MTVASYGGVYPSRIREPAVVGTPRVQMLSLMAIGHAVQRAGGAGLAIERTCPRQCAGLVHVQERVQRAVDITDAIDRLLDGAFSGQFAAARSPHASRPRSAETVRHRLRAPSAL